MKLNSRHIFLFWLSLLSINVSVFSQSNPSPAPYCNGGYTSGNCLQGGPTNTPGNSVNDFIDNFITSGASSNISNTNSGCNANPNNYAYYCQHFLSVLPGQVITCSVQSGIIYAQGFAIFIDWNQDNVFQVPAERVAATSNVPGAATWTVLTFTVPPLQANGVYRMRVRCAWATPGVNITPCGTFGFGETEDYSIFIGAIPANSGPTTATLSANSPLCAGQTLSLVANSTPSSGITYTWTGPNSFTSTLQNPLISNVTTSASGVYSMITGGACPASKTITISVVPYPVYTVTPNNPTICQGGSITAAVNFTPGTNTTLYSYTWAPNPGFGIFNTNNLSTIIMPPPINVTQSVVIYSVTVSRNTLYCPITQTLALTINNPSPPLLNLPAPMCNTAPPFLLSATPGGGTWSANNAVSPPGSFTPGIAAIGTNTLVYSISVGPCVVSSSGTMSVSQFITPALSSNPGTLCVQDPGFNLMGIVQNTLTGFWSGTAVSNNSFFPVGLPTGSYPLTYSTQSTPIASVCPASTVYAMQVFNPPSPVISPVLPKCNTAAPVQLSASPSGGIWTGSGISASGLQSPSQNLIGTNTLTYTAGQGTCVASSTATFHVSQFNTAAFSGTLPNMCVNNSPFNLFSIVQTSLTGVWSGVNVIGNYSFNPAGLPTGNYTLTYNTNSTPNPNLCPDTKSIVVSVLNPPAPNITPIGPICNKGPALQLSVTPATGHWVSSGYLNTSGLLTPSNCAPGNNLVQYVIGTQTCQSSQGIQISVEAFVPASIIGSIPDQCNTNSAVNLQPYSANNVGAWSGPGVSGASFNPALTGAGSFSLYYSTSSSPSGLCPDQSTLAVRVYSLAAPSITKAGPFCNSSPPVQLQVTPTGGIFGSPVAGAINPAGLFYPSFSNFGDNVVSYSISSGPCVAYAESTINVVRFVSADFDHYVGPFCRNSAPVNMDSYVKNPGGIWAGTGITGNMFNPALANTGINNIITYTTWSVPNPTLCPDSSAVRIRVNTIPQVSAVSNTYQGCAPLEVLLNFPGASNNVGQGYWNLGDGSQIQQGTNISYVYTQPGTYTVSFEYRDEIGCEGRAELSGIEVFELPRADFSVPSEVMISDPVVQITNLSTVLGNNKYKWNVGQFYQSTEVNPKIKFDKIGLYQISLEAQTIHQCKDQISKTIEVKNEFNVYIPGSFTPNYDGLNDVFMPVFSPYGLDTKTYELEIFDRWGHLQFSTKDVTKGWDGSVQNKGSEELKEDVYVYKIKYKDLDGNVYSKMGHVSLLK